MYDCELRMNNKTMINVPFYGFKASTSLYITKKKRLNITYLALGVFEIFDLFSISDAGSGFFAI